MSKKMTWTIEDPAQPEVPHFGDWENADLEVTVVELNDGGDPPVDLMIRCLCAACFEIEQVGVLAALGVDELKPGIYYLRSWHESYVVPWVGEEHDGGLMINEAEEG